MNHEHDELAAATDNADATPVTGWAIDLDVAAHLTLPAGAAVDREEFFGWLWAECGDRGLLGIDEGAIDVAEAAAAGLVPTPLVVDAAAAPADRDWIGSLDTQAANCWFADEASARSAAGLLAAVGGCRITAIRPLAGSGPAVDWRATFAPIIVPGFGVVRPAWEPGQAGTTAGLTTMFIEPGCGFGTGAHETTRLCLAALAAWTEGGGGMTNVLDFGSGSGILAIAAAVRGAARVAAVEIDRRTHDAIRDNGRRNGVAEKIEVLADLPEGRPPYDLVFANIVPAVLLEHAARLCDRVARGPTGGCLILSGLLADQVEPVSDRYGRLLAAVPLRTSLGDWHCLEFVAGG